MCNIFSPTVNELLRKNEKIMKRKREGIVREYGTGRWKGKI
jgi:hypothetical protein